MAATLGHPFNQPSIDPKRNCVDKGYGMLQPRLAASLPNSRQSLFTRLFAGDVGIDPYTREISNIYQDLFGQAQFVGKGIYDVKAFDAVLGRRFPENRILSHDMIEGCYARCGFLNDVELVEEHPSRYLADVSRRFRWARGDWQIARWLLPTVPGPDGKPCHNPLRLLAKWMIIDNLRRTLVPLALFGGVSPWVVWDSKCCDELDSAAGGNLFLAELVKVISGDSCQIRAFAMVHPHTACHWQGIADLGNRLSRSAPDTLHRLFLFKSDSVDRMASAG